MLLVNHNRNYFCTVTHIPKSKIFYINIQAWLSEYIFKFTNKWQDFLCHFETVQWVEYKQLAGSFSDFPLQDNNLHPYIYFLFSELNDIYNFVQ